MLDPGVLFLSIILSTFIVLLPQMFFKYEKYRKIKEMERMFPSFLRDLVEHVRAGEPLHTAIINVSNVDYGELSKEVKRIAAQLSWGIPIHKVLEQFAERVESRRLSMAVEVLRECYLSGGDVALTLESLGETISKLEDVERERKAILNQYVVIIYIITLLFIGVVTILNNFMIPIFEIGGTMGGEVAFENPCNVAYGPSLLICDLYRGISSAFAIKSEIASYYVGLFFLMTMVQAFFGGLIIGQITRGSITAGFVHSILLSSIVFGSFGILSYLGVLG